MSLLAKIFETEEVIKVRQVRVKKYKVNWNRLFHNFLSLIMFWKKQGNPRLIAAAPIVATGPEIDGKPASFQFTKELSEWTAKNTLVRDGFGSEGNQKESVEKAKEIRKQQKENKR
jgi:hypothetical protein